LQQLVQQDNDESSSEQLDNQEDANAGAEIRGVAVQTSKDVNASLTERDDNGKELPRSADATGLERVCQAHTF